MESVPAAARGLDRSRQWQAVAWGGVAIFAVLWLLLTGWVDGEAAFRVWTMVGLPLWALRIIARWQQGIRLTWAQAAIGLVWGLLWWLTTCSYAGDYPGEECYVTKAQHLLASHLTVLSVLYGLFPLLVMASVMARSDRTPPT